MNFWVVSSLRPLCEKILLSVWTSLLVNIFLLDACMRSLFHHVRLFVTLWTVAHQFPLSMNPPGKNILEWVAMPSSRESSQPRDQTRLSCSSCIAHRFLYWWATREAPSITYVPNNHRIRRCWYLIPNNFPIYTSASIPFVPCSCQHLMSYVFFILHMLIGVMES